MWPAVWILNHVANWVIIRLGFEVASEGEEAHSERRNSLVEWKKVINMDILIKSELTFVDNVFDLSNLTV